MATSQNGWPALAADSSKLFIWTIPATTGTARIRLRNGSAGFILCHFLLWFAEVVEPLAGKILDDWGWAWRPIRGQVAGLSNHASGTAVDANATRHPLGKQGTFRYKLRERVRAGRRAVVRDVWAYAKIRARLALYAGAIRWGGDYNGRKDEMHFEVNEPLPVVEKLARRLMKTPRGRRLLKANPGQDRVILS